MTVNHIIMGQTIVDHQCQHLKFFKIRKYVNSVKKNPENKKTTWLLGELYYTFFFGPAAQLAGILVPQAGIEPRPRLGSESAKS